MDIAEACFQTSLPPFVTGDAPCHKICHAANPDRIRLFYIYISIVTVNIYRYNIIVCVLYLNIVWDVYLLCLSIFSVTASQNRVLSRKSLQIRHLRGDICEARSRQSDSRRGKPICKIKFRGV
jgi:hypothetical protein